MRSMWINSKTETKYFGHCEHLHCSDILSMDCLKRYYTVYNPVNDETFRLAFCNDYLRLNLYNKVNVDGEYYRTNHISEFILETMELRQYNIEHSYYTRRDAISIIICDRPYTYLYVSLKQLMLWFNDCGGSKLFDLIDDHIRSVVLEKERFKKHFSWCSKVKTLLFNMCKYTKESPERTAALNEIALIIIKSVYNETH